MRGRTLTISGVALTVAGLMLLAVVPTVLPLALSSAHVYVRDLDGVPIQGATVYYEWWRGEDKLVGSSSLSDSSGYVNVPYYPANYGDELHVWAEYSGTDSPLWTSTYTNQMGWTINLTIPIEQQPPPQKGTIIVDTIPVKGIVYVNGQPWGTAPQSKDVDPATYTVSFGDVAGYTAPSSVSQYVSAGETWTVTGTYTQITPTKATISIDTTPIKGTVYVNDMSWGTAPQTRDVDAGTYTVSFGEVAGYLKPPDQTKTLSAGETWTVTGTYTEQVGTFSLSLDETSVQVMQGETKTLATVTALATGNWTKAILLSSTVPSGAGFSLSFGTNPIDVGGSSVITGSFTNAVEGTWSCEIKGSSGGLEDIRMLTVTVLPRGPIYKTVSGVVRSTGDDLLGNVRVSCMETGDVVYTNNSGYYSLQLEKDGSYTLRFELTGYGIKTSTFTLTDDRTLNVTLEPEFRIGAAVSQIFGLIMLFSGLGLVVVGATKKKW